MEKRSNRSDKFDLGGTADSSNSGANMGGTMGSSVMKNGGGVEDNYEKMVDKLEKEFEGKDLWDDEILDEYEVKQFENDRDISIEIEKFVNSKKKKFYVVPYDYNDDSYYYILVPKNKMKTGGSIKEFNFKQFEKADDNKAIEMLKEFYGNNGIIYGEDFAPIYDEVTESITDRFNELENKGLIKLYNKDNFYYKFVGKKANGGGLANTPESFPSNDAMSYKDGGVSNSDFEKDYKKFKQHIKEGYGKIDSGYVETTWENMSDITYSAIEDKLMRRLEKDELFNYAEGGTTKGFEYSIGGL